MGCIVYEANMSYVLIAIGLMLAYLDYLGSSNLIGAGTLLGQEMFTNSDPYYKWAGAFIIIGLLGYVPEMRPVAVAMLVLVILAVALSKQGAVANLEKAL